MSPESLMQLEILMNANPPDHTAIKQYVLAAYAASTGEELPPDIAPDDMRLKSVAHWYDQTFRFSKFSRLSRLIGIETAHQHFFPSLSSKIFMFAQTPCLLCNPTDSVPVAFIPIRIRPLSHQHKKSTKKNAFKPAIASRFSDKSHLAEYAGKSLCVNILFVVKPTKPQSDLDNLAKLLLDSFIGYIYEDDRSIDHLSLLRIAQDGDEEYICARISDSSINTHADVLYHGQNHGWGMDEIVIENFY